MPRIARAYPPSHAADRARLSALSWRGLCRGTVVSGTVQAHNGCCQSARVSEFRFTLILSE